MSVNTPVHTWTSERPHRPAHGSARRMVIAVVLSMLLVVLLLVAPALEKHSAVPIAHSRPFTVEPVMVLNSSCSPFAALSPCLTTTSFVAPAA